MGLLDFWKKKKPVPEVQPIATPVKKTSATKPTPIKKEVSPHAEAMNQLGDYYRNGNYQKAYELSQKVILLGGKPNDTMLSVIRSRIQPEDLQTLSDKLAIIGSAIDDDSYIEFYYPSTSNPYYELITRVKPVSVNSSSLVLKENSHPYEISKVREVRSFKINYYSEKPI